MKASNSDSFMCLAPDQGTGGRERGEWEVVVASLVLCSLECMECLVLRMHSTGLHFPVPRCLLLCYLHFLLCGYHVAVSLVRSNKTAKKNASTKLHVIELLLSSFSFIEKVRRLAQSLPCKLGDIIVEEQEKFKASNSEKYTIKELQSSRMPPSVADLQDSGRRSRRWRGCRALCTHAVAAAKQFTGTIH